MTFGESNKLEGGGNETEFTRKEVSVFGNNVEKINSTSLNDSKKLSQKEFDKIIYSSKNDKVEIKNDIEKNKIKNDTKLSIKQLFERVELNKQDKKEKIVNNESDNTKTDYFKNFEKRIEKDEVLTMFSKTKKGMIFLEYITKYSSISIEKFSNLIQKSSEAFDVPEKYFVSLLLGEFDASKKKSPFLVNSKGIGQFTEDTWKELLGKNANVLNYFKTMKKNKYYNNLKNLNISSLADRGHPDLALMGVGAYLQYINIARELDGDYYKAIARYNVGMNKLTNIFINNNPIVVGYYHDLFGKPKDKGDYEYEKMLIASNNYYAKYTKNA